MATLRKLTQKQNLICSQDNLLRLTTPHEELFKVIISHQIYKKFRHSRIKRNRKLSINLDDIQRLGLYERFGSFLDKTIGMSITEVENIYKRKNDSSDVAIDARTRQKAEVIHFCTYVEGDIPLDADSIRIHGYYTLGGYFVVIRLDWHHEVH